MIKLLFPILFPSWRFFSSIGPSPRIELGFVTDIHGAPECWSLFRPIPGRLTFIENLIRLCHNPQWNELLFINTCAERFFEEGDDFYIEEISKRLLNAVSSGAVVAPGNAQFMLFRIRAIYSETVAANQMGQVRDEVFMQSQPYQLIRAG